VSGAQSGGTSTGPNDGGAGGEEPSGNQAGSTSTGTYDVDLAPQSPLAGGDLLQDEACLTSADVTAENWGLYLASRSYMVAQGYTEEYVDEHFCPIDFDFQYNPPTERIRHSGTGRVTYKATFEPYYAWWQHHFPVFVDDSELPTLTDGAATVDETGEAALIQEREYLPPVEGVLPPNELGARLEALVGPFDEQVLVNMGPSLGIGTVRLYAQTQKDNPASEHCSDRIMIGTVDAETGEGAITFSAFCN
jgi:hypothetical protein